MTREFAAENEKLSYALGLNIGEYVSKSPLEIMPELLIEGLRDCMAGSPAIPPEEYAEAMRVIQEKMKSAGEEQHRRMAGGNAKAGAEFLAANRKKEGVKETASGLQYKVVREGAGPKPEASRKVRVHYTGKLIDGTVFDSSVQRGEPAEFALNQVIPGWTEALQLMSEGSEYTLYIPSELAYGERGAAGAIPPNAALIFEVQLLKVL